MILFQTVKFNARATRLEKLRSDIDSFSGMLEVKQKTQNGIRAEAFTFVCQLQTSAAILAPANLEEENATSHGTRLEGNIA